MDHYLSRDEIDHYHAELKKAFENAQAKSQEHYRLSTAPASDGEPLAADISDWGTVTEERELNLNLGRHMDQLAKKLHSRLTHFDPNEFGYCEVCGTEIGRERLDFSPMLTTCQDCASLPPRLSKKD